MPRKPRPRHKTVVRYTDPAGNRCKSTDPGAVATRTKTASYYAKIGGKFVPLRTTDEAEAWAELRRLLAGGKRETARPLAEHVSDYVQTLADRGTTAKHRGVTRYRIAHLVELARWASLQDVTSRTCLAALARLQSEEGLSAQTRNYYLAAIRGLLKWAHEDKRVGDNPLVGLRPINVETDRRHDRRSPTDQEVTTLFAWLANPAADSVKRHFTGSRQQLRVKFPRQSRALLYKTAMSTGFRADEMRSLSRPSFNLDAATVTVEAAYSKHRRRDVQPLPPWLVDELRAWFAGGGECWGSMADKAMGKVLKQDLAGAGIPYVVDGLCWDFHSFRSWYVTQLANQEGISPKVLMSLARHTDPKLTLRIYAKTQAHGVKGAVEKLPVIGTPKEPESKDRKPG